MNKILPLGLAALLVAGPALAQNITLTHEAGSAGGASDVSAKGLPSYPDAATYFDCAVADVRLANLNVFGNRQVGFIAFERVSVVIFTSIIQ